jgi:2-dehydropantoate 2-reductase
MSERIAVLGAGAIGASMGAYLIRDGRDVTLIDYWAAHVDAMKNRGLTLTDLNGTFTVKAKALHLSEVCNLQDQFDIVILSVKSYDTRWITYLIEPYLKPTGFILPAQNSLNDETVAHIVGFNRTVGCIPMLSAGLYQPGHAIRTSPLDVHCFTIGELSGVITPRAQKTAQMLSVIGHSDTTTNIWGARWSKLVINCLANALAGIVGPDVSTNAAALSPDQQNTTYFVRTLLGCEAAKVASALGFTLGPIYSLQPEEFVNAKTREDIKQLKEKLEAVMKKRYPDVAQKVGAPDRPSLLQDIIKGRRTEVDYLNGIIVNKGKELGIPTPMNEAVLNLTRKIETGEVKPGPHNLETLKPYLKM